MSQMMLRGAGSSGPGSLSWPANLAALDPYVWLDATRYSGSDGDAVTTMANAGSLGGNFSNTGGTVRPTYRAAGLSGGPSFQFDGGDYFQLANVALSTFTCIALFKATAHGFICEHTANTSGSGHWFYTDDDANGSIRVDRTSSTQKYNASDWGIGDNVILARHVYGGTHATHKLWVNGADVSLTNGAATADPGTGTVTDTLNVGSRNGLSLFLTGHIAQLIFFPLLSDANAAAVEAIISAVYP